MQTQRAELYQEGGGKPTWAGTCEKHGLLVQATELNAVFSIMAVHLTRCAEKVWAETYSQYLSRLGRGELLEELRLKQLEVFVDGKDQVE